MAKTARAVVPVKFVYTAVMARAAERPKMKRELSVSEAAHWRNFLNKECKLKQCGP